jgi:hypothetical protein
MQRRKFRDGTVTPGAILAGICLCWGLVVPGGCRVEAAAPPRTDTTRELVAVLLEGLKDTDPDVRASLSAAFKARGANAVPVLAAFLSSEDHDLSRQALLQLCRLSPRCPEARAALARYFAGDDALINAVKAREHEIREAAQEALAQRGPEAVPLLVAACEEEEDLEARRFLLLALSRLVAADGVKPRVLIPGGTDLRVVNKKEVNLTYRVLECGSSQQPKGAEGKETNPPTGSVSLVLDRGEKTHGYHLVAQNRAGFGQAPPRSGDRPQARFELDMTPPKAEMYIPLPDPSWPNREILSWLAEDRNLADKPITLEWAPRAEGPWKVIGEASMPNTGKFSWVPPNKVPPEAVVRLTVFDRAGNRVVCPPVPIFLFGRSIRR